MIAEYSGGIKSHGNFEFYIRVTNEEGRVYHLRKSVPDSEDTEENMDIWKQEAIAQATQFWIDEAAAIALANENLNNNII